MGNIGLSVRGAIRRFLGKRYVGSAKTGQSQAEAFQGVAGGEDRDRDLLPQILLPACAMLNMLKRWTPTLLLYPQAFLGEAIDKILDMNMFFMPEQLAGRRPLLYKIAVDPNLVKRLRKLVWEHAEKFEWVSPTPTRKLSARG